MNQSTAAAPRQAVRSPEQVALDLPLAGPTARMLAYVLDYAALLLLQIGLLLLLIAMTPLADLFGALFDRIAEDAASGNPNELARSSALFFMVSVFLVIQLVVELLYFVCWELASGGRSLGKLALRLRVVRDGGLPLRTRDSLIRNLLRIVDVLPFTYVVGLVAMILSDEGKRLGDLAAETVVVRLDRTPLLPPLEEDATAALSGSRSGFRFDRTQIERVGRDELRLARQTLRRRDALAPEQARAALTRAAEVLRSRIGYAEPVEEDEAEPFLRALLAAARKR